MKNPISADNYFDDFDFKNSPIIKHPMIKQLQENQQHYEKALQEIWRKILKSENKN